MYSIAENPNLSTPKMQTLYSLFGGINLISKPIKANLSPFSSISDNSFLFNYLIETFNFPKERAIFVSNKFNYVKSPEKPQSVVHFLQTHGFSEAQIRSSILVTPQILFCDVHKNLKPKIELFQQLGLVGSHLGKFISKHSFLLSVSLEKRLIPNIEILKKILVNDKNNKDLITVITRSNWVLSMDPKRRLLNNIEYLESCGIVGSQLSSLLKRQPRLFTMKECKLREIVSRTLSLGHSVNSRMLVHALHTVSSLSEETIERKLQVLKRFGFSQEEFMNMFRRAPAILNKSAERLKLVLEFFLYKMGIKREVLLRYPVCLMFSLEDRVIPRYNVLEIVKSKRLLKKEPSFKQVLRLSEKEFLEKFVSEFRDDTEELLVAYKGHELDSSFSAC